MNPEKLKKLQAQVALVRIGGKGKIISNNKFKVNLHDFMFISENFLIFKTFCIIF